MPIADDFSFFSVGNSLGHRCEGANRNSKEKKTFHSLHCLQILSLLVENEGANMVLIGKVFFLLELHRETEMQLVREFKDEDRISNITVALFLINTKKDTESNFSRN